MRSLAKHDGPGSSGEMARRGNCSEEEEDGLSRGWLLLRVTCLQGSLGSEQFCSPGLGFLTGSSRRSEAEVEKEGWQGFDKVSILMTRGPTLCKLPHHDSWFGP